MAQTDYSTANPLPADDVEEGADTKLLSKDTEGRIVTKDMTEVKYNAGDHRNGDARVEIPDTVRTFTGLTKEELRKYAEDPFWVRLRWIMFVLFWLMWLCMLAGAVAIIVRSPKCAPRKWYQKGPLLDMSDGSGLSGGSVAESLTAAARAQVAAVVLPESLLGNVYANNLDLDVLKKIVNEADEKKIKVVLDVTPNLVSKSHQWFKQSESKQINYTEYFVWSEGKVADGNKRSPPNNWLSTLGGSAWEWSETRSAWYLHQYAADTPDLNFRNAQVKEHFRSVLRKLFETGIAGVRLLKVRQLVTAVSLEDEKPDPSSHATTDQYSYYKHEKTTDQPELKELLDDWRQLAETHNPEMLVWLGEAVPESEPYFAEVNTDGKTNKVPVLPLPSVGAIPLGESVHKTATRINRMLPYWPAIKFTGGSAESAAAAAAFSLLLPATPVLTWLQATAPGDNDTRIDTYNRTMAQRHKHLHLSNAVFGDVSSVGSDILSTQWSDGNEHFLGLYNVRTHSVTEDIAALKSVPETLMLYNTTNGLASKSLQVPSGFSVYTYKPVGMQ